MVYCRILNGKWNNRGFLFGPYCPIYGFGAIVIIYTLIYFIDSPVKVFFLGMLFASILEYITSFLLEKIFKAKWWDYSTYPFNFNGRICLLNSLEFGILGLVLTYISHPFISDIILKLPSDNIQFISFILVALLSVDSCSTIISLSNLKQKLSILYDLAEKLKNDLKPSHKLSDFAIYKEFDEVRKKFIRKRDIQIERLLAAFPSLQFKEFSKQMDEFKHDLNKFREDLKNKKKDKEVKKLSEKN